MNFSCKKACQLASEKLDRKLSLSESLVLKFHLFMCGMCQKYCKQINFIHLATKKLGQREDKTINLSDTAKQRINAKMESARQKDNNN